MAIQGFTDYGGFYNQYRVNDIPKVNTDAIRKQEEQPNVMEENLDSLQQNYTSQITETDKRSKIANLENISLTFQKENTFDYIGSDSEIGNLDIQKAVSDMKKDQVLEEYQYFVGSAVDNSISDTEDGRVLQK